MPHRPRPSTPSGSLSRSPAALYPPPPVEFRRWFSQAYAHSRPNLSVSDDRKLAGEIQRPRRNRICTGRLNGAVLFLDGEAAQQ